MLVAVADPALLAFVEALAVEEVALAPLSVATPADEEAALTPAEVVAAAAPPADAVNLL